MKLEIGQHVKVSQFCAEALGRDGKKPLVCEVADIMEHQDVLVPSVRLVGSESWFDATHFRPADEPDSLVIHGIDQD